MQTKFEVKGLKHTLQIFENLRDQIGDAKKSSRILTKVAFSAMKPVLSRAQQITGEAENMDTGMLHRSLAITSRRPTNKDMRSNYIYPTDSAIALVTTKPIPKHLKREVNKQFGNLWAAGKKDQFKKARKEFYKSKDVFYDARAVAQEFGTAHRAAQPFLRISLESQQREVTELAGMLLAMELEKFKDNNSQTT